MADVPTAETRRIVALAIAIAGIVPMLGAAASPAPVLRHLRFSVSSDATVSARVSASNFGSSGSANALGPEERRTGTVTADVVAATGDGGLAVDVSEQDDQHVAAAPVRVGVLGTDLYVPAGVDLTDEERMVLHGLARGLVQPTTLTVGTRWTEDVHSGSTSGRTTYTITSVDDAAKTLVASIAGTSGARGLDAYAATTTGTMDYDVGRSVPTSLTMRTTRVVDKGDKTYTTDGTMTAKLVDDSFAKKP